MDAQTSTADLLAVWRDAERATELALRVLAEAQAAAAAAEVDAQAAERLAIIAEAASRSAERAARIAREAADLAKDKRDGLRRADIAASGALDQAQAAEDAAGEAYAAGFKEPIDR